MGGNDLAEVLHRPLRSIPGSMRETFRRRDWTPQAFSDFTHAAPGRSGRALQRLDRDLIALRQRATRQPTTEVLRYIADVIGLGDVAASLDASAGDKIASSHIDDLDALMQVADHCPAPAGFETFLTEVVTQPDTTGPAVTLSTIHSVKGLEWPDVVIVGCAEGGEPAPTGYHAGPYRRGTARLPRRDDEGEDQADGRRAADGNVAVRGRDVG